MVILVSIMWKSILTSQTDSFEKIEPTSASGKTDSAIERSSWARTIQNRSFRGWSLYRLNRLAAEQTNFLGSAFRKLLERQLIGSSGNLIYFGISL